jgi:adenosylcobinamide kinase/adenosylcobinamide-phosphate guanylyltransferase
VSNLVANEMFSENGGGKAAVINGIENICKQAENVVFVTNDIFRSSRVYDGETDRYMRILGEVNENLANKSDKLLEIVCGIPIVIKGEF